jgi:hypothetical protein
LRECARFIFRTHSSISVHHGHSVGL